MMWEGDVMKYCRYCAWCCEVDCGYYCSEKQQLMTESKIKQINNCKDYAYTTVGDVITGKQYQPRRKKNKIVYGDYQPMKCEQIEL